MAEIVFCSAVPSSDPSDRPVTILGKKANLKKVPFSDVAPYLAPRVSAEVRVNSSYLGSSILPLQTWACAVDTLREGGGSCSLWLTAASVAALPTNCSRHNTPSQAHALTKLVQGEKKKGSHTAIIVSYTCSDANSMHEVIV